MADEVLSGGEIGRRMARRYKVSAAMVSRVVAAHRTAVEAAVTGGATGGGGHPEERIAGVLPVAAMDERLLADRTRVCVVDPLGVWWGLRAGADGAAVPGRYPVVVFGGRHAGVALVSTPAESSPDVPK